MIIRLGSCPLPIKIHMPILSLKEYINITGLIKNKGNIRLFFEKESMYRMYLYKEKSTNEEHIALIKDIKNGENVPIRIHSSCITAETFDASNCDCHEQLEKAFTIIEHKKFGGVIWLHQEGRGNGLVGKMKQIKIIIEEGLDTVEAFIKAGYPKDQRTYSSAAMILKDLKIRSIQLITNNPNKIKELRKLGIKITKRIPCEIKPFNYLVEKDLLAKKRKLGHFINLK